MTCPFRGAGPEAVKKRIPIGKFERCGKCGCVIDWKASLEKQKCPEGKW